MAYHNLNKAFIMPCNKHESKKIGFVCTKPNCKERLICTQCYKSHPDSHKESFISIMEVFADDFSSEYEDLSEIIKNSKEDADHALQELDHHLDQLKEDLLQALEEIREEIKSNFKHITSNDHEVTLKYHTEKMQSFMHSSEELVISSRYELAESLSKFMEIRTQIKNTKIQPSYVYNKRTEKFQDLKKYISGMLTKQFISKSSTSAYPWKWNTNKMSSDLQIKDEGFTVCLPTGSGNHGIIGDIVMKEGYYEWSVEHDPNIKDGFWGIGFGLIAKKHIETIFDWENFPYSKGICRSTSGTVHNMSSIVKTNLKGKVAQVKADLDEGKIRIYSDGNLLAEGKLEKGEEYVPFLDFNHCGTAKLSF